MMVYPGRSSAVGLKHAHDPRAKPISADGGVEWPDDGYTFRLVTDGTLREAPPEKAAHAPSPVKAKPAE